MTLDPLYRLPHPLAQRLGRLVVLSWFGAAAAAAWVISQAFAYKAGGHAALGPPWLAAPGAARPWLLGLALLTGLAAAPLAVRRLRAGLVAIASTAVLSALALGPLYTPFHAFLWYSRFRDLPAAAAWWRVAASAYVCFAALAAIAALAVYVVLARRWTQPSHIHGSAAWAQRPDVHASGLLQDDLHRFPQGILLALWPGRRPRPLVDTTDRHVLVFAPTRSGKGVGIVVPNLLSWPESALITDIKGENWHLTAGYRTKIGQRCLRFDPTDTTGDAARYNPLREIRLGDQDVRDAQNLAEVLVDPNGDKRTRDHWDRTAHALLTALILHVLYDRESPKTLTACADVIASGDPSRPGGDAALERMQTYPHLGSKPHPYVARLAQETLLKPSEERGSVVSTALSYLALYRDPILAANIAESDFALDDLMNAERPTSLYLTIPPTDLARTRVFIRLLLNQFLSRLAERLEYRDAQAVRPYRHRLLLLLDELPALGHLHFLQHSLAFVAGYGIRALLIAQDLSQLHAAYSRDESITSNAHTKVAFTPNRPETAELLSRILGDTTVHQKKRSVGTGVGGGLSSVRSTYSDSESKRPLLTPDEALRFPAAEAIVLTAGARPIRALRFRFFDDPQFLERARLAPPPGAAESPRKPLPGPWDALGHNLPPAPASAPPAPAEALETPTAAPLAEPPPLLPQPAVRPPRRRT